MNHRQKEIMKFITLGCIVAVVVITSRFIPLSKIFSLYTGGTSVSTEANFAELGSNAEIATEITSRIANMTPEERKEAERPPLPDENKAQLVNPEGETLFQQYRGNYDSRYDVTLYGDVFIHPPTRHSFEGEVPNPQVFPLAGPPTDLSLTKKAAEVITNMFSFRTQNYASLGCALVSFEPEDLVPSLNNEGKHVCALDGTPQPIWIKLMEQDAYARVDTLSESFQGQSIIYDDSKPSHNGTLGRAYTLELGFYDKNNVRIGHVRFPYIVTSWRKTGDDWKMVSRDIHWPLENIELLSPQP
ncbi:hypothetical protein [Corynebacterium sp. HS2168-gen11]|uniref:hypothetical protein n=1 Tax=Corynebacterium sp. HS2168-gen11 TaxID=2974027 RepID=UPI00216ACFFA|nr:hypothetical protein [Corynebacterium sp. HS2168-gen11]MCS4536209.1 hypothetical protein [Corynebacterium sp. HS2168-gen11]